MERGRDEGVREKKLERTGRREREKKKEGISKAAILAKIFGLQWLATSLRNPAIVSEILVVGKMGWRWSVAGNVDFESTKLVQSGKCFLK